MPLLFKINNLSLHAENQTGSRVTSARLSLYFKPFIHKQLSCI